LFCFYSLLFMFLLFCCFALVLFLNVGVLLMLHIGTVGAHWFCYFTWVLVFHVGSFTSHVSAATSCLCCYFTMLLSCDAITLWCCYFTMGCWCYYFVVLLFHASVCVELFCTSGTFWLKLCCCCFVLVLFLFPWLVWYFPLLLALCKSKVRAWSTKLQIDLVNFLSFLFIFSFFCVGFFCFVSFDNVFFIKIVKCCNLFL